MSRATREYVFPISLPQEIHEVLYLVVNIGGYGIKN